MCDRVINVKCCDCNKTYKHALQEGEDMVDAIIESGMFPLEYCCPACLAKEEARYAPVDADDVDDCYEPEEPPQASDDWDDEDAPEDPGDILEAPELPAHEPADDDRDIPF